MRKSFLFGLKKLDAAVVLIDVAAVIAIGIFRPGTLMTAVVVGSVAVSLYSLLIRRDMKAFGVMLMATGLAVILALASNWLYSMWDKRDLRADFEQESANAMAINRSILDNLQGSAELEKLKQLAMSYKAGLATEQTIAQLEIPRIGVNSIVVEGTGDSSLRKGPGHLEETPLPGMQGNFSVAGDRVLYGGPFLNLDELENGDEVFVKTPYGKFTYSVTSKTITDPEDVSILKSNGKEVITLITCDPPWDTSHRLVIQATMATASLL